MDLKPEEQALLNDFRKLTAEARREVLNLASLLAGKEPEVLPAEPENRCMLDRRGKERLETSPEPIFTE